MQKNITRTTSTGGCSSCQKRRAQRALLKQGAVLKNTYEIRNKQRRDSRLEELKEKKRQLYHQKTTL